MISGALGQHIFEAAGDGLVVHDLATGRVLHANPSAWRMHGCEHDEFVGQPLLRFVHPGSGALFAAYCACVAGSGVGEWEGEHVRVQGQAFAVDVRGTIFTVDRRPAILSVIRDASTRVAAQRLLEQDVATLHEQTQTLAILAERQRLAHELHDAINQSLFSAGLIAEVLPQLWERSPLEGQQALLDLRRLTRGALAEMRMLLAELRPLALSHTDLGDLLRLLGAALAGRTTVAVTTTISGTGVMPAEVQVAFYRLCQEALTNVAKHAEASAASIELDFRTDVTELRIVDNGCGFDPASVPSGHYGLSIMRERAESVGASLTVTSAPGAGATIAVRWRMPPTLETSSP